MTQPEIYYLLKLNPPPRHVCVRNNRYSVKTVYECRGEESSRIQINCLQTGTIRETRGTEEWLHQAGDVYISALKDCFRQELLTNTYEPGMWIVLDAPPVELTAEEAAVRALVTHEALLPSRVTDPAVAKQVTGLVLAADQCAPFGDELRSIKLRTHMYWILMVLTQHAVAQARKQLQLKEKEWSRQTAKAIAYMQEHLQEKLAVETIAAAAGDKYSHLKTVFHREVGMTMVEYINYQRIQKAKELISLQDASAESAGEAVGIPDTKYLGRLFRRYTGMSIQEYRRVFRESIGL